MREVGHTRHLNDNTTMVKVIRHSLNNSTSMLLNSRITSTSIMTTDMMGMTVMEVIIMDAMIRAIMAPTKIRMAVDNSPMSTKATVHKMDTTKVVRHLEGKINLNDHHHQHSLDVVEVMLETDEGEDRHSREFWNLQPCHP
jgi:hypothetical protein